MNFHALGRCLAVAECHAQSYCESGLGIFMGVVLGSEV